MPVPCAVLNVLHPVIGIDFHQPWIPPAPPAPIPVPHFWLQILGGLAPIEAAIEGALGASAPVLSATVKRTTKTYANFTATPIIQQSSDIGPFIIHIPAVPHVLLPLIILGSGSVSEFGAFSVQIENRPVGTAMVGFAGINLDCAWPVSMPTGIVVAISTICAGMKLGDYMASAACLIADVILSGVITLIGMGVSAGLGSILGRFIQSAAIVAVISNAGGAIIMAVLGVIGIGSPVGYSSEDYSLIGHNWGGFKDRSARRIADYYDPPPGAGL
jgi:hypothetical protein